MDLRALYVLLRRWAWLVILATLLLGGAGYLISRLTTPVYSASSKLLVSESRTGNATNYNDILSSQLLAKTYSDMLNEPPVLNAVIQNLKLETTAILLLRQVSVVPVRETQLIQVSVESSDAEEAARIANELPRVFIEQNDLRQSSGYAASRQSLSEQMAALDKEIKTTQSALDAAKTSTGPAAEAERARLEGSLSELRRSYSSLVQSYEQVRMAEAQTANHVYVVAPAEVPAIPIRPNTLFNTLFAAIGGFMLGVGIAFVLEQLDDTLKTPTDVQETLGLTALATVPRQPVADRSHLLLTGAQPQSSFAEAFRTLRTNIQFSTVDKPLKTILVTSSGLGEGKSTVAANLAIVLAQAGRRTLLVDADLRRPSIHTLFGLSNQRGLTSLLVQDPVALDSHLNAPPIENLRVLTSGPIPPNPSELLGSQRMTALLDRLKQEADVIVIDSPPVPAVSDASVLASRTDGVLLVVESGSTRRDIALRAKEQLAQVSAQWLGAVVNKLSARTSSYDSTYYYYNYYYADADATADGPRPANRSQPKRAGLGSRLARAFAVFRQDS